MLNLKPRLSVMAVRTAIAAYQAQGAYEPAELTLAPLCYFDEYAKLYALRRRVEITLAQILKDSSVLQSPAILSYQALRNKLKPQMDRTSERIFVINSSERIIDTYA